VEQTSDRIEQARESGRRLVSLGMPSMRTGGEPALDGAAGDGHPDARLGAAAPGPTDTAVPDVRWLMASDVCKHCTHAACLDVCPTGSLFRTEFGTVVVQDDICNGCGYCVAACPFGVIERRRGDEGHEHGRQSHGISIRGSGSGTPSDPHGNPASHAASNGEVKNVGIAQKCTLCYDRIGDGQQPACAQACPTTSIKFGDLAELRETAQQRVAELHELGYSEARLYGANTGDGVGGTGSVFLLLDEPEVYGLPPDPRVTTADLPDMFRKAGYAGLAMLAMAAASFLGRRR
jgi:formate dehydrogenase iron-sulfur subunit